MSPSFHNVGIIGAGAWGTALASVTGRAGLKPVIWAFEPEVADAINARHENKMFLPGVPLDPVIEATTDLKQCAGCDLLLLAMPAQHMREIARQLVKTISSKAPVIICAKGIEQKSAKLLSEVLAEELPQHPIGVLSGPSFAGEVAHHLPTALTFAIEDKNLGQSIVQAVGTRHFRLYVSDDVTGAQIGGAVKNVLAVACGIVAGRQMGDNARAALITRGLAEMMRLGVALGARTETLMGLSGLGDLVLTCSSLQSRNMSLGAALGQGKTLLEILGARKSVTEGVTTAAAAHALAEKHKIEMPIVAAVDAILNKGASIEATIEALLARPFKAEHQ